MKLALGGTVEGFSWSVREASLRCDKLIGSEKCDEHMQRQGCVLEI